MKASEEKEAAAHALEKADNDPQSTKAKIDKVNFHLKKMLSHVVHLALKIK